MGQDTGYGMMGKDPNPNPNNRTEQEYRALIRSWKEVLSKLLKEMNPSGSWYERVKKMHDDMEKEVP